MNEKDALLSAIMSLPPKRRDEFWNELVAQGIIREEMQG